MVIHIYSYDYVCIVSYCWCVVITVGLGWFGILVCRNTSHLLCMVSVVIYTYIVSDSLMSCFGITLACEHYPVWHETLAIEILPDLVVHDHPAYVSDIHQVFYTC